jgi:hypothetical protein
MAHLIAGSTTKRGDGIAASPFLNTEGMIGLFYVLFFYGFPPSP